MQIATIQTLQKDLDLGFLLFFFSIYGNCVPVSHLDIEQLKDETSQMVKAERQICAQILEKQRKIASMESGSSTLSQVLIVLQKNIDEAVEKLKSRGIEVFGVVCQVFVAQQRKNLVERLFRLTLGSLTTSLGPFISKHYDSNY
ncbi:hypothetical protein LOK49_LG08G00319 [Camellia lanceoleosa]|uniref:Uncharacterized protein n=1 Tax=Camellia lanceoleosa TaxID=1840588 RepID=A0ACC0GXA6_9ERIC|nr:hypothetical protein LOK49_LG08G00319 [Camellia lanceoleosa]